MVPVQPPPLRPRAAAKADLHRASPSRVNTDRPSRLPAQPRRARLPRGAQGRRQLVSLAARLTLRLPLRRRCVGTGLRGVAARRSGATERSGAPAPAPAAGRDSPSEQWRCRRAPR